MPRRGSVVQFGVAAWRVQAEHEYHTRLLSFSGALEHSVTANLLVLLGGRHAALGIVSIFLIHRLSRMLTLWGSPLSLRQRGRRGPAKKA